MIAGETDPVRTIDLHLGALVDVAGWTCVVTHELRDGSVQVCRRGSERWMRPSWVAADQCGAVSTHTRYLAAARSALKRIGFDPDGWRRIPTGRYGGVVMVRVDHVSQRGGAS